MQRLFGSRFAGHLSHAIGQVADVRVPSRVLRPVIKAYSLAVGVEMDGVIEPTGGFESFGDFFVRRLRSEVRPLCLDRDAVIYPSDGRLVGQGPISSDGDACFSIKGQQYDITQLLGTDDAGESYGSGEFAVIYLHPRDYHRVHVPADGRLVRTRHIPGHRFPVAPWSERRVPGLYGKNERVVFELELGSGGKLALVMVAAFGVGNIETPYAPRIDRHEMSTRELKPPTEVVRGDDLGAFRLGSTVVMIWSAGALRIDRPFEPGVVQYGTRMGILGGEGGDRGAEQR